MWVLKSLKNTLYFICLIYKLQFAIEYIQIGYILNVLCFFSKGFDQIIVSHIFKDQRHPIMGKWLVLVPRVIY